MADQSTRRLTVLVTAHPDDESMFFVPTIQAWHRQQQQQQQHHGRNDHALWLLCLTTGDYDGLGRLRVKELQQTARHVLGIPRVLQVDHAEILDHPTRAWNIATVARVLHETLHAALQEETQQRPFASLQIITFDQLGVSGHINHRDTYLACRYLCLFHNGAGAAGGGGRSEISGTPTADGGTDGTASNTTTTTTSRKSTSPHQRSSSSKTAAKPLPPLELWCLVSDTDPLGKYFPMYAWILLLWSWCGLVTPSSSTSSTALSSGATTTSSTRRSIVTHRLSRPSRVWQAMAGHTSQFVWYRRLFVMFASYTYVNRLQRVYHHNSSGGGAATRSAAEHPSRGGPSSSVTTT